MLAVYLEGFTNKDTFHSSVLKPLIVELVDIVDVKKVIYSSKLEEVYSMEDVIDDLPNGRIAIFLEGSSIAYVVEMSQWDKRTVDQPESASVIRGPKEGFIEDVSVNKVLIRRILRNNNLVYEDYKIGKQTKTKISIAYIKGIANEDVLREVKKRLKKIDIDAILESGYIEQLIEDHPKSYYNTIGNSEKPDIIVGKILEGRVAILIDGTPHVLTMPRLFIEGLMTSEDYYLRPYYASLLRLSRFLSLLITIYLPGVFLALQLYHQEMIPTKLLISAAGAREGVPLPAFIEIILMVLALELTKESGIRLSKSAGSTVSIVGALILGQSSVQAGVVSALTVIVVSIAAIAEYTIPDLAEGVIVTRLMMILLGAIGGLFGITCGFMITTAYLLSLDSFGIPYCWPIAPRNWEGLVKDTFIRAPIKTLVFRPKAIERKNLRRQIPPKEN